MTRRIVSLLCVAFFAATVGSAFAQEPAPQKIAPEQNSVVVAPCTDCVVPCGYSCCAPCRPYCDPCCYPPVIGYRRGFFGVCRPVYAPVCDPCYPVYPRFHRGWYRGYGW